MRHLREIYKAANRASDLVKQVLRFSREKEEEKSPVKLKYIIEEATAMLKRTLPSSIEMKISTKNCGPVVADPGQMHQIIMNLCINASHAMMHQKGKLEVALDEIQIDSNTGRMFPEMTPGPYARITVSDTGSGMTPDIMERIFNPYFTTKGAGKGTGLGLSIVRKIVKNHQGFIKVFSEPEIGTTFHVYIPVIPSEPLISEGFRAEEAAPSGTENIMVVDDETPTLKIVTKTLERLGYTVTAWNSSVNALETFKLTPYSYDLVITDMTMPGLNGAEFSEEILRIRPHTPIILMTGFSELITVEQAKNIGIQGYIMKPVLKKDLADMIKKALQSDHEEGI